MDLVRGLADQVTEALRSAIDGRSAHPRLLAVGLLGVLEQMPTVFSFKEGARKPIDAMAITAHDEPLAADGTPTAATQVFTRRGADAPRGLPLVTSTLEFS